MDSWGGETAEGIDIVSVARVDTIVQRYGDHFLRRCFTPGEIRYCSTRARPAESYAARLAAKEAVSKALRNTWKSGGAWHEIEIVNGPDGAPHPILLGRVRALARRRRVGRILLSLSHCGEYAVASATILSRKPARGPARRGSTLRRAGGRRA
jgi:holo-[acyl-carrier protein] synthase